MMTTADAVCDVLVSNFSETLASAVEATRRERRERALTAFRSSADQWDITDTATGSATGVRIPPPPTRMSERISVHTHPVPGPIGFSVEDYLQFCSNYLMSHPFDSSPVRGYAVLGQRYTDIDRGQAILHVIAPTAALTERDPYQRHRINTTVRDIADRIPRHEREMTFPQADAIRDALEPVTSEAYCKVDVSPVEDERLNVRLQEAAVRLS
jgi:hypothetical protein